MTFLYLFFLFISFANANLETLKISDKCSMDECVIMDINWGRKRPKFWTKKSGSHTIFTFKVEGKLNDKKLKLYHIELKGFTDGMECGDFGQSSVAVLGTAKGNPLIETSSGILEIVDNSIFVGCSDCLQIIDEKTKKVLNKYFTPGWDLTLTGHKQTNFSYDNSNNVYILSRKKCLKIPKSGSFSKIKKEKCAPLSKIEHLGKQTGDFKPKPAERYYKLKGSKSILLLKNGACT